MMTNSFNRALILPCLVWIIICLAIASLSSWITHASLPTWYFALHKPSFNPPNWVFAPVWTTLYIMIGISGGIIWHYRQQMRSAFNFYLFQLLFNFAWSFLFFGAHLIGAALIDMVLLVIFIFLTITASIRKHKVAAWLLVPYLAWVLFALTLNFKLWQLN